jgi:hypothetical protein
VPPVVTEAVLDAGESVLARLLRTTPTAGRTTASVTSINPARSGHG